MSMLMRAAAWRLMCGCFCCHLHALAGGCANSHDALAVPYQLRKGHERLSALPTTMKERDGYDVQF